MSFGPILSCKVSLEPYTGKSKGYGFVHFKNEESALNAIKKLNRSKLYGKEILVSKYLSRADREKRSRSRSPDRKRRRSRSRTRSRSLDRKGRTLRSKSRSLTPHMSRRSRSRSPEVRKLRSHSRSWTRRSRTRSFSPNHCNREKQPSKDKRNSRSLFDEDPINADQNRKSSLNSKSDSPNDIKDVPGKIIVKNLDNNMNEKALYDVFLEFGDILSCEIIRDAISEESQGFGFVHFKIEESALTAVQKRNGTFLNGKQIFVEKTSSRSPEPQINTEVSNIDCDKNEQDVIKKRPQVDKKCFNRILDKFGFWKPNNEVLSRRKKTISIQIPKSRKKCLSEADEKSESCGENPKEDLNKQTNIDEVPKSGCEENNKVEKIRENEIPKWKFGGFLSTNIEIYKESLFKDVKCQGCEKITTIFSQAQTTVSCFGCSTVLQNPKEDLNKPTKNDDVPKSRCEENNKVEKIHENEIPKPLFKDVKCQSCEKITTIFSQAQTTVSCFGCSTVLHRV